MSCFELIKELSPLLKDIGEVVIAGGACRDELLGRSPKDYDAFVLCPGQNIEISKETITEALLEGYGVMGSAADSYSTFIADVEIKHKERPVQVIVSQCATLEELLATFDWNICLYGAAPNLSWVRIAAPPDILMTEGLLKLNCVTRPVSTLSRGFRFCHRYSMRIDKPDLVRLCSETLACCLSGESEIETEREIAF